MLQIRAKVEPNGEDRYEFSGNFMPQYEEMGNQLMRDYRLARVVFAERTFRKRLKPKQDRVCRFCGGSQPTVTFNKKAHLVPAFLGNKILFSDQECDSCNAKFGEWETDFSHFLGLALAFIGNPSIEKTPTLIDKVRGIFVRHRPAGNLSGPGISITSSGQGFAAHIDNDGALHFDFTTPAYIPYHIYLALLKCALSFLPDNTVKDYFHAFLYLANDGKTCSPELAKTVLTVHRGTPYSVPRLLLFEKTQSGLPVPTHLFLLQFYYFSLQIALPLYTPDLHLYNGKQQIGIMGIPPLLDRDYVNKHGEPMWGVVDLSSMLPETLVQQPYFRPVQL